jgi:uncharacterized membrane protein YqiK
MAAGKKYKRPLIVAIDCMINGVVLKQGDEVGEIVNGNIVTTRKGVAFGNIQARLTNGRIIDPVAIAEANEREVAAAEEKELVAMEVAAAKEREVAEAKEREVAEAEEKELAAMEAAEAEAKALAEKESADKKSKK